MSSNPTSLELSAVLDGFAGHVAIVNADGLIVAVNAAWRAFAACCGHSDDADTWLGMDYLRACVDDADGAAAAAGIRKVLDGQTDAFDFEYPCHNGEHKRWFCMQVRPLPGRSGAVINHLNISASKLNEFELQRAAMFDALTQLPNRRQLEREFADTASAGIAGLIFIDVDRLKRINDSLGHQAGDRFLAELASRLHAAARPGALIARIGGDEFAILVREAKDRDAVVAIAREVQNALAEPIALGSGHSVEASASIGVAVAPPGAAASATLLRDADTAMYRAKARGRAQIAVFEPAMQRGQGNHLAMESALRQALAEGELLLHYQPLLHLATGKTVGYEALVRWQRPGIGCIGPDAFIPMAEETGLIEALGAWVLRQACCDAAASATTTFANVPVSVNVSGQQLAKPQIVADVTDALAVSGLAPSRLILEIAESAQLQRTSIRARLAEFRALGVRVAIDDFGTGNTSLAYLRDLNVDVLKLDRSFIERLGTHVADSAIVAAVVDVATAVGLTTIGEGVETADQHERLAAMGCELGQGFLYGVPAPLADLPATAATR